MGLYEHALINADECERCLIINRISRFALLAVAMPAILIWVICLGLTRSYDNPVAWSIHGGMVATIVVDVIVSVAVYKKMTKHKEENRLESITLLRSADFHSPDFPLKLSDAFAAVDADDNGKLDMDEARHLMKILFEECHEVSIVRFTEAMLLVRK